MQQWTLITWIHSELARLEIGAVFPECTVVYKSPRAILSCEHILEQELAWRSARLWSAAKRGRSISRDEAKELLSTATLLWTNDEDFARRAKKETSCRRYKIVDIVGADLEIKQKGVEIIVFGNELVHIVWRQNIDRYTTLDIEKPMRGMQIGMMPAKLTQTLVNIGVWLVKAQDEITVRDPFCGFGTTLFVANACGYHTIGSDILITSVKGNLAWWKTSAYATDAKMTVFKHDATQATTKPFIRATSVVVTEWRLWPVMTKSNFVHVQRDPKRFAQIKQDIIFLYQNFLTVTAQTMGKLPIVMTVPVYPDGTHMIDAIASHAQSLWRTTETLPAYRRAEQVVGRGVVILR